MTEAVLLLSGVLVKTAFALWSGDNKLGEVLSGDLTEMIKGKVQGRIEQRKILTRFASLEEIVADRLLSALAGEYRSVPENDKNAAVYEVALTIEAASLTNRVLYEQDLDPRYLERHIRGSNQECNRVIASLGPNAGALYSRLLAECCAYIIEIADKLPKRQYGDAFAELLHRDRQILARIKEVLDRLPVSDGTLHGSDAIDVAYRQRVVQHFDKLEMFGLDFSAKQYSLSIAYVNLRINESDVPDSLAEAPFEMHLAQRRRILLTGRAGSGKTTVLQWLAVRASRADFTGEAAKLNGCHPFFLRLRHYVDQPLPTPEQFMDRVAPLLAPEAADGWIRMTLRHKTSLILIDGVDELPEARRASIAEWLQELVSLFPHAYFVITSRPNTVEEDWLRGLEFTAASLDPMHPALIKQFIRQWHQAMREWEVTDSGEGNLHSYEAALLETLDQDPHLRSLADTPLLAGLMCALNQHLKAQLPKRRGEIYEKALVMFDQRDKARGITSFDATLDFSAVAHLLGQLALWMVRNGALDVRQEVAQDVFATAALHLTLDRQNSSGLYRHLLVRSGLLREPSAGRVDFVHRTFEEFLAARALVMTDSIGEIVKNASDDQWSQIVILAAGQTNLDQTGRLLGALIKPGKRERQRRRRHMLAVAALAEVRAVDPGIRQSIEHVLAELLPPKTMEQAESLGQAGPIVMQVLQKHRPYDTATANATIRAVTGFADDAAMDIIRGVATMPDVDVLNELLRAWMYFDLGEYAKTVLSTPTIDRLHITAGNHHLLPLLHNVEFLAHLRIDCDEVDVDLSVLGECRALEILYLSNGDARSLSLPRAFPNLRKVRLDRWLSLSDMSALSKVDAPHLRALDIFQCPSVVFTNLEKMSGIQEISLEQTPFPNRFPLGLFPRLSTITVGVNCGLVDLSCFAYLPITVKASRRGNRIMAPFGMKIHYT